MCFAPRFSTGVSGVKWRGKGRHCSHPAEVAAPGTSGAGVLGRASPGGAEGNRRAATERRDDMFLKPVARSHSRIPCGTRLLQHYCRPAENGWVAEWSNAHAWKACLPQGNGGSNPPPSATSANKRNYVGNCHKLELI